MYNNDGKIPEFEKFPGSRVETTGEREVPPEQDFAKSFQSGVPEFAGFGGEKAGDVAEKRFGQANPENMYYGEAQDDGVNTDEAGEEFDAGISDAAALINYGLNAAARDQGVETVVQAIKGFDASGREDPIGDLFRELGVDTPEEAREVQDEAAAAQPSEAAFRDGANNPGEKRSHEGAFKALDDMKELIAEVEGADPRYEDLRAGARAAGKGYFEYAVMNFGVQGLTELFGVLAEQREKAGAEEDAAAESEVESEVESEAGEDARGEAEVVNGSEDGDEARVGDGLAVGAESDLGEERETLNPEILRKNY